MALFCFVHLSAKWFSRRSVWFRKSVSIPSLARSATQSDSNDFQLRRPSCHSCLNDRSPGDEKAEAPPQRMRVVHPVAPVEQEDPLESALEDHPIESVSVCILIHIDTFYGLLMPLFACFLFKFVDGVWHHLISTQIHSVLTIRINDNDVSIKPSY